MPGIAIGNYRLLARALDDVAAILPELSRISDD